MESINYIVILLVIIALLILFKISIGKLMQKGEEFLNLEDDIGIYHNNVGSHMRSVGYEKDNSTSATDIPSTTHHLNEMTGLISADYIVFNQSTDTTNLTSYYQLAFDKQITVYGLMIKAGLSTGTLAPTFDVKYSLNSTNKDAFIPLLDKDNNKKTITLSSNAGYDDDDTVVEEKEFPVPITAKYIRIYNNHTEPVNFNVDAIIKPMTYLSLKQYDVKKVNTKITKSATDATHEDKTINIGEHANYISHVDSSTPLKPYSDKLGRREIFKFDVRTPHFDFTALDIRNKPTFDAYIIRSTRGTYGEFCHLNDDNEVYCDRKLSKPTVLLRFHMTTSGNNDDELDYEKSDDDKTMIIQHFKSGLYANSDFKFVVKNAGDAQKFIISKHTVSGIKNIVNLDDYIDKKEAAADTAYTSCQEGPFTYINLRRPYNDATLIKEHPEAMVNRDNKVPKKIQHVIVSTTTGPTTPPAKEGIYIYNNSTNTEKKIKFRINNDDVLADADTQYSYLKRDSTTTFDNDKFGPYCSGIVTDTPSTTVPTTTLPNYIYDKLEIKTTSTDSASEWLDPSVDKYKPEIYEGRKVEHDGTTKYIAEIKKHTPTSLKNYTPDTIKICIPKSALNPSSGNLNTTPFIIKTKLFNVIDSNGKTMELEFTVNNNNLIKTATCSDANIVNNMYKIYKTSDDHYEIAQPNDPKYKTIDCGCNCLGDKKHVEKYRKTNNFVKSILDNVIVKTDNIMSQRNRDLSEIKTQEETLFNQPDIQDYNDYENTNLLDTNPFREMDEVKNYYNSAGLEGFSDAPKLPTDLETLKREFIGIYKPFDSQFLLLDGVVLQIDKDHIGFIKNNTPIYKLRHDNIKPFFSPYGNFDGITLRIVSSDKMVHTFENRNFEKLLQQIGFNPPNFIYLSRHHTKDEDSKTIRTHYKISNRQHSTLMQMEKI